MSAATFQDLQMQVIRWAEARKIIPHSTPQAQLLKTVEELGELVGAVVRGNKPAIEDGFGDVLVTLILAADLSNIDLTQALAYAYDEIKDRRGTMSPEGVFVKES